MFSKYTGRNDWSLSTALLALIWLTLEGGLLRAIAPTGVMLLQAESAGVRKKTFMAQFEHFSNQRNSLIQSNVAGFIGQDGFATTRSA